MKRKTKWNRALSLGLSLLLVLSMLPASLIDARAEAETFTVTFENSDGTVLKTEQVTKGETVGRPDTPFMEGQIFVAWVEKETGDAFDFESPITGNLTLRPQFQEKTVSEVNLCYDKAAVPYHVAYTESAVEFAFRENAFSTHPGVFVDPDNSILLRKSEDGKYSHFYNAYGGGGQISKDAEYAISYAIRLKPGFEWLDKKKDSSIRFLLNGEQVAPRSIYYNEFWKQYEVSFYLLDAPSTEPISLTSHKVGFETNGGGAIAEQSVPDGSYATEPKEPKREGFVFAGWYEDPALSKEFEIYKNPIRGDMRLYARWRPVSGKPHKIFIHLDKNGKGIVTADKLDGIYEGDTVNLHIFPNAGYALMRLTVVADNKPIPMESATVFKMPAADVHVLGLFAKGYSLTIAASEHGRVETDATVVAMAAKVPLRIHPDPGYMLDKIEVIDAKNETVECKEEDGSYSFIMPGYNVTVKATFKKVDASFQIKIGEAKNGTLISNLQTAGEGMKVELSVSPEKGFELENIEVLDAENKRVSVEEKNGIYEFKMPRSDVRVKANFKKSKPDQEKEKDQEEDAEGTEQAALKFTDVKSSDYFAEAVAWALDRKITTGTSEKTFAPHAPCTRAQMVTFLWRAAGEPKANREDHGFSDVKEDAYYKRALLWALEEGIVNGTSETSFSPDLTCTRAQMASVLYRYAKSPETEFGKQFSDVKEGAYYQKEVGWAAKAGITSGTSETTFSPDQACTRAQIVTFLYRYMSR